MFWILIPCQRHDLQMFSPLGAWGVFLAQRCLASTRHSSSHTPLSHLLAPVGGPRPAREPPALHGGLRDHHEQQGQVHPSV